MRIQGGHSGERFRARSEPALGGKSAVMLLLVRWLWSTTFALALK
jgi:hypothetical protein